MLEQSDRIDINDFTQTFKEMACLRTDTPVVICNGLEPMKEGIWEKVGVDDAFEMAVRWCSFFATPSDRGQK